MNAEQLLAVRADDARLGEGDEGLQMWPAVYTQRRWLLKALDAREADTKALTGELSKFFGMIGGGTTDLADLVQRLQIAQQRRAEILEAMAAQKAAIAIMSQCGYCRYEEADGELLEQCAKCKAKDNPEPPPPQRAETGHPMLCGCAECM